MDNIRESQPELSEICTLLQNRDGKEDLTVFPAFRSRALVMPVATLSFVFWMPVTFLSTHLSIFATFLITFKHCSTPPASFRHLLLQSVERDTHSLHYSLLNQLVSQ